MVAVKKNTNSISKAWKIWRENNRHNYHKFYVWSHRQLSKQRVIDDIETCSFDEDREVDRVLRLAGLFINKGKPPHE